MDTIQGLQLRITKQMEMRSFDNDVKVNMCISDIKYWCDEFFKIDKNIEETSISPSHKIERKQKLINDLLNK